MNNITLARLLLSGMYNLACMVCSFQMGRIKEGQEFEEKFMKLIAAVDEEAGVDGGSDD